MSAAAFRRSGHGEQGVTLIELLIGLAVTAMLMAPLASIFSNTSAAVVIDVEQLDLQTQVQFALQRIERQIRLTPTALLSAKTDATTSGDWLAPITYSLGPGTNPSTQALIETIGIGAGATSHLLAEPVSSFSISSPSAAAGKTLIAVALTLAGLHATASANNVSRMGGAP